MRLYSTDDHLINNAEEFRSIQIHSPEARMHLWLSVARGDSHRYWHHCPDIQADLSRMRREGRSTNSSVLISNGLRSSSPRGNVMPDDQCQHCGQTLKIGHNCDGKPFVFTSPSNSIQATGARKETLERKGFHETSNVDGVYYYHPTYGLVFIYPGGVFRTGCVKTALPLDAYLESLPDSSYTEIQEIQEFGQLPHKTRCDACGGVGPLFPDEHDPFLHKPNCPQGEFLAKRL
jgi:hypothetical protein